jgi:hypothetical protein
VPQVLLLQDIDRMPPLIESVQHRHQVLHASEDNWISKSKTVHVSHHFPTIFLPSMAKWWPEVTNADQVNATQDVLEKWILAIYPRWAGYCAEHPIDS